MKKVLLPHGAVLNRKLGVVEIPINNFILKIKASQIPKFAEIFDDLTSILMTGGIVEEIECPTCGILHEKFVYNPPEETFGEN